MTYDAAKTYLRGQDQQLPRVVPSTVQSSNIQAVNQQNTKNTKKSFGKASDDTNASSATKKSVRPSHGQKLQITIQCQLCESGVTGNHSLCEDCYEEYKSDRRNTRDNQTAWVNRRKVAYITNSYDDTLNQDDIDAES